MPYYDTLDEDIARAKEILAKGKPAHDEVAYLPEPLRLAALSGGTIYGADVYAAYKLLESFVAALDRRPTRNTADDIGFDEHGQPIMIGAEADARQDAIVDHPDATPVLVVAMLHNDLGVRVFGPPREETAAILEQIAATYRAALAASRAGHA